jgi:DNA polymerase I-like protein with 3'-5' exonuclease and polymerase domains
MMLDYAEQLDLIEEVKGGLDVHTATAKLMGVARKPAKTLNFLLLYGGGVVKLALELFPVTANEPTLWVIWKQANGWRLDEDDKKWLELATDEMVAVNLPLLLEAEKLRNQYFSRLPKVQELVDECKRTAADRGYIRTWTGRRIYFKRGFAYKAPNALIQGGASDVCKTAIVRIDDYLKDKRSKLLLSVHDELVLKIHAGEMHTIDVVKDIMQTSFPHKHLPLTAAANIGNNLWEMDKFE